MCECFHQDWLKIRDENSELVKCLLNRYKPCQSSCEQSKEVNEVKSGVMERISEIKKIISSTTEFDTNVEDSLFRIVGNGTEIIHICAKCFKNILFDLKVLLLPLNEWFEIYQTFDSTTTRLETARCGMF